MEDTDRPGLAYPLLAVAMLAIVHRATIADFGWMLWTDRDLVRSAGGVGFTQWMGAELSYGTGARIPGGGMHILTAVPLVFTDDPVWVYRFQGLCEAVGLGVLAGYLARRFDMVVAAVTVAVWASVPITEQAMAGLWHPALLAPWAALATAIAMQDRPTTRDLALFAAAVAIGAQMHMSALFLLAVAPWMLWRSAAPRTGALALLAGLVGPWLPYLVMEALQGAPNTLQLMEHSQVADLKPGAPARFAGANLRRVVGLVFSEVATTEWRGITTLGTAVGVAILGSLSGARQAWQEHRTELISLLLLIGMPLQWYARSSTIDMDQIGAARYLLVLVPALGILVGLLVHGSRWRGLLLWLFFLGTSARLGDRATHRVHVPSLGLPYTELRASLDALQELQPARSPGEILAGTRIGLDDGGWLPPTLGVDHLVERVALGAQSPPCGLIVPGLPRELPLPAGAEVLQHRRLGATLQVATWMPASGLCPTSFTNRYIRTPEEQRIWAANLQRGDTQVHGDTARARVGNLWVSLTIDGTNLLLESNQLRGGAYNNQWFANPRVRDLRVELQGIETVTLPVYEGAVGNESGILGPFRLEGPAGRWQISLAATLEGAPVEIPMFESVTLSP